LIPTTACLAGVADARGDSFPWLLALCCPLLAMALGVGTLLVGWLHGALIRPRWLYVGAVAALGAAGWWGSAAARPPWIRGALAWPGELVLGLADGTSLWGALVASLLASLGLGLAALGIPPGHSRVVDRTGVRSTLQHRRLWPVLGVLLKPLGRTSASILQRDLAVLLRGGFLRGSLILAGLPGVLLVFRAVLTDKSLKPWQAELAALLIAGLVASAVGYVFGVDYPRARVGTLVLERTQPVRGRQALVARWAPGFLYSALLVGGLASVLALAPRSSLASQAGPFLFSGLLLALLITHDAAAFGLRVEAAGPAADADTAGYPLRGGTLIVVLAVVFLIAGKAGFVARLAAVLVYPLLGYMTYAGQAERLWERAEVDVRHPSGA
jgi:hypothetical protein